MIVRHRLAALAAAFVLILIQTPAKAQNYVQEFSQGRIDWTSGVIEADGWGMPPEESDNPARARADAERGAVDAARANLYKVVMSLRVSSNMVLGEMVENTEHMNGRLLDFIKQVGTVDVRHGDDGSARAVLTMDMKGAFADLVLPEEIRVIKPVRQPKAPQNTSQCVYSGVVIDCRGFEVKSAMVPLVMDEEGGEVYGPAYVSREHALKRFAVGYAHDLETARNNPRVAENPLVIKGVRIAGSGVSDVVISNADAAVIRGTPSHIGLLQECRVVMVID